MQAFLRADNVLKSGRHGLDAYIAAVRLIHIHRPSLAESPSAPEPPAETASVREMMQYKLRTEEGRGFLRPQDADGRAHVRHYQKADVLQGIHSSWTGECEGGVEYGHVALRCHAEAHAKLDGTKQLFRACINYFFKVMYFRPEFNFNCLLGLVKKNVHKNLNNSKSLQFYLQTEYHSSQTD
jgi:hypothetical protein